MVKDKARQVCHEVLADALQCRVLLTSRSFPDGVSYKTAHECWKSLSQSDDDDGQGQGQPAVNDAAGSSDAAAKENAQPATAFASHANANHYRVFEPWFTFAQDAKRKAHNDDELPPELRSFTPLSEVAEVGWCNTNAGFLFATSSTTTTQSKLLPFEIVKCQVSSVVGDSFLFLDAVPLQFSWSW